MSPALRSRSAFWSIGSIAAAAAVALALAVPTAAAGAAPASPSPHAVNSFGRAVEIKPPPSLDINNTGDGALSAVSCPAVGSCVAGGGYFNANGEPGDLLGMVTSLAHGKWSKLAAFVLPDNAGTNPGVQFNSISCGAVGYCAAVGSYTDFLGRNDIWVAVYLHGSWQPAFEPSLPADAAAPAQAGLSDISCTSRRDCVAVGSYVDKSGNTQIMILTETAGFWQQARRIAAPTSAAKPINAQAAGISCPRTGTCVAVGGYVLRHSKTFVPLTFTESRGAWHRATGIALPRNAVTGKGNGAGLISVSCTASGFCAAVASYATRKTPAAMMSVTGMHGLSGRAAQITATPLKRGRQPPLAYISSIACVSASRCVAVGSFQSSRSGNFQAMSLIWTKGRWGNGHVLVLPKDAEVSYQLAGLVSVSCRKTGYCVAVGSYIYVPDLNHESSAMAAVMP
jgi:hypothetical protein